MMSINHRSFEEKKIILFCKFESLLGVTERYCRHAAFSDRFFPIGQRQVPILHSTPWVNSSAGRCIGVLYGFVSGSNDQIRSVQFSVRPHLHISSSTLNTTYRVFIFVENQLARAPPQDQCFPHFSSVITKA